MDKEPQGISPRKILVAFWNYIVVTVISRVTGRDINND